MPDCEGNVVGIIFLATVEHIEKYMGEGVLYILSLQDFYDENSKKLN